MSSRALINCLATVSPKTVDLSTSQPCTITLHLTITLSHPVPITVYIPATPIDSGFQSNSHSHWAVRDPASDALLEANSISACQIGEYSANIKSPSTELLTLYPGRPQEREVILGVHDEKSPFPGRPLAPIEERMTVCAVPLMRFVPGDYTIELANSTGRLGGLWFWDEGEKQEVVRRHSIGGDFGWVVSRVFGKEQEIVLGEENLGGINLVMIGEAPRLRIVRSEQRKEEAKREL